MNLNANVGDDIVVDPVHIGEPQRKGEILELIGGGEQVHYRIRWDEDGHESLFFPGTTAHVVHTAGGAGT